MKVKEDLEKAKRRIDIDSDKNSKFSIETSVQCPWEIEHFRKVPDTTRKGVKLCESGRLVVPISVLEEMIKSIAIAIKDHISNLLMEIDMSTLNAVLMVGGFSNSPFVYKEMKKLLSDKVPLIIPEGADLCIVKGAVIFGWNKQIVRKRKSRFTYGICVSEEFVKGYHDESKSFFVDDSKRCKDLFQKLVTKDDQIPTDKGIEWIVVHSFLDEKNTRIELYATEKPNAKYCDDEGVASVGKMRIPKTEESKGKKIRIQLFFGTTEVTVIVHDDATKKEYTEHFNFFAEK